jgi:hypothetical protein
VRPTLWLGAAGVTLAALPVLTLPLIIGIANGEKSINRREPVTDT